MITPEENGLMPCGNEHDFLDVCHECDTLADADAGMALDSKVKDDLAGNDADDNEAINNL